MVVSLSGDRCYMGEVLQSWRDTLKTAILNRQAEERVKKEEEAASAQRVYEEKKMELETKKAEVAALESGVELEEKKQQTIMKILPVAAGAVLLFALLSRRG